MISWLAVSETCHVIPTLSLSRGLHQTYIGVHVLGIRSTCDEHTGEKKGGGGNRLSLTCEGANYVVDSNGRFARFAKFRL